MKPEDLDPTDPSSTVVLTAGVRAILALIPIAGGAILEAGASFDPLKKRTDRWRLAVFEALKCIQEATGRMPEELGKDERFISTMVAATEAATKTHKEEKIRYLKTALISCAAISPAEPDREEEQLYLQWIEYLTVSHIQVLAEFSRRNTYGTCENLEQVYNTFKLNMGEGISRTLFRVILEDLFVRSLLIRGDISDYPERDTLVRGLALAESSKREFCISELGRDFLEFIGASQ